MSDETFTVSPSVFGGWPACALLADEFNRHGADRVLFRKFIRLYNAYQSGVEDIIRIPGGGTRALVLQMWFTHYTEMLGNAFAEDFAARGMTFSIALNVFHTRWKHGVRDGDILERLGQAA
jgi:hypothetical protein